MRPDMNLLSHLACVPCLAALLWLGADVNVTFAEPSFDELRSEIAASTATQSEERIFVLLTAGIAENQPSQTIALTRKWLQGNVAQDPRLLYQAGKAAELSGDWRGAVALYQQYLKRADLNSAAAADAVLAVYSLLLDQLDDVEGAYAYMSIEGHRLHVCHRAPQFDRWYLDLAVQRRDHESVAKRLLACVKSPATQDDLLVARYDGYFRWLLAELSNWRMDQPRFSPGFSDQVKQLTSGITFDEELQLRLAWTVSVKQYNMNLLDGEDAVLPLAEATALLKRYPQFAELVQTGWAERRGRHYKDDPKKYWPIDLADKMEPVKAAAKRLDGVNQADFYRSWEPRYYDSGPQVLSALEARAFVLANPNVVNRRSGPALELDWAKLTFEEAQKLAPHLEENPSFDASFIRAIVAGGAEQDFEKAFNALLGPEAWRLPRHHDQRNVRLAALHKYFGSPESPRMKDRWNALPGGVQTADARKEDSAAKRLAVFRKLWNDLQSTKPALPSVFERTKKVLEFTPEAIPELLKDERPLAQIMAREAIAKGYEDLVDGRGRGLSPHRYDPSILRIAHHNRGMDWLRQYGKDLYKPHPFEPALRTVITERISKGNLEAWLVMAWLNAQFPENNDESKQLMAALVKSPVFATLPHEVRYGARAWFPEIVMTAEQLAYVHAADPQFVCKNLLSLTPEADAAKASQAISNAIAGIIASPERIDFEGLERLAELNEAVFADPQVQDLLMRIAGPMRTFHREGYDSRYCDRLWKYYLSQHQDQLDSAGKINHQVAPYFWRHTEVYHRSLQPMIEYSASLVDIDPSAASAWSRCGLQTIGRHRHGHTYYNRETDIPRLKSIQGKAALAMGLIEIPVPANDPAYPIFRSQAEFVIGNEDSAIELVEERMDQLLAVNRNLSVSYLLWVLQHTIDTRDEARQEELVKALRDWSEASTTAFSLEQRLTLDLAYGDIAMQRGMLPEAHQIYSNIQGNEAYEGIVARHDATLRRVRVERISKDFDAALNTLDKLASEKIPQLITAAHHARAEVYYDMEEFEDAAEEITVVLKRDPAHSDATILRGRVQLKLKRLIEATEVELGSVAQQASLVPGEVLKVTLNDPTLSVSSGGTEIEVVVWATSGDREHLLLRQFGDEKTKYRGDVRTALGKPQPGDKTLQVVGDDEVYYAYSERFRAKVTNLGENRGGPIQVSSDGMLMASARRLLSANEQRVADMERVAAAFEDRGIRSLNNTDPELVAELKATAAAAARQREMQARVKPGNPIHLRVIDPDRGRTAEVDELAVTLSTSSGDTVSNVVLKETGTHTGQFEGQVRTSTAQASAFATSTETGRNPNTVISPNDSYNAWRPIANQDQLHAFTVDLNDNAALGTLTMDASDPGFGLKSFLVQSAMNGRDWTSVAATPHNQLFAKDPWRPSVTVVSDTDRYHTGGRPTVYALDELQDHLDHGWLTQRYTQGLAQNVAGPSEAMPASIPAAIDWKRQSNHDNCHVVYRFRGWFHESANVTRKFRLTMGKHVTPKDTHPSLSSPPQFLIAVDGRPISEEKGKLEGSINLREGLHRFEIWGIGWVESTMGFGRTTKLQANLEAEDEWVDCPDAFFDPAEFPQDAIEHRNAPAELTTDKDSKQFTVKFAKDSRARLLRILFLDQEGPTPSLNRLTLTTPDGDQLLPAPEDFAELRKNQTLEILTGDKVTVRYVDDRYVTKGRQKHERFLNVAYTDGRIEFADIEPRFSSRHGKKMPYYERLLRFQHDKPFPVVIRDADMDVSIEPDQVSWRVIDGDGNEREFIAKETGPSTGVFQTLITPVVAKASTAQEVSIPAGGQLQVIYRDAENDHPGVPTDRYAISRHAQFQTPVIEIAHMDVTRTKPNELGPAEVLHANFVPDLTSRSATAREQAAMERIRSRYDIRQTFVNASGPAVGEIEVVQGRTALIDVICPNLALSTTATIDVFLQTDAARKLGRGSGAASSFDVNVPGTLRLEAALGRAPRIHPGLVRAGYRVIGTEGVGLSLARNETERIRQYAEAGRFRLAVPLIAGKLPKFSYADPERVRELKLPRQHGLTVQSGERVHIGVRYRDRDGKQQWITATATVVTHPMLDVMTETYRRPLTEAFVGERVYLRIIDLDADQTDGRDAVRCFLASKSGQKHYVQLRETDSHSGIFKGSCQLTYATADTPAGDAEYDVKRFGFPVIYGDAIGARYTNGAGAKTPPQYVTIGKGSDGTIAPFSKQYKDSEVAMKTQFAMAESYLELARRHRQTGETKQADREFTRAKQLLEYAVSQFTDAETRAHAEYLLGGLTQEDAEGTTNPELQRKRYQAALARFMTITGSYADTEFASKAQFKIARIYEALKEPEIAAQEYVKLAYKHPDSEHLATAMARLGTHFQRKAVTLERQAAPLLAQAQADSDDKDAAFKGEALQKLSRVEYVKAAQIFERLQTRFPNHDLASKAGLRAGQIYMRAQAFSDAVKALLNVVNNENYDGPTLRSEAMYWTGKCHQSLNQQLQAYALYKRITYDFPESKWAAYARAELSTERLLQLDRQLEIERLEEGR